MPKLLIIADDFTGALDTGVQLARNGVNTLVVSNCNYNIAKAAPDVTVLVINAETRHLKPTDAALIVQNLVKDAHAASVKFIYKKTDSALRGNVGAELAGALAAGTTGRLHFIPAFPQMDRVTVNGQHLINGVPVAESVFGHDPFNPVVYSDVKQLIQSQTETPVMYAMQNNGINEKAGIVLHDAATTEDLWTIGQTLKEEQQLGLMAGCAGFASLLSSLLELDGKPTSIPQCSPQLFVACASINPITAEQIRYSVKRGFANIRMTPEQTLGGVLSRPQGQALLQQWLNLCQQSPCCILDTTDQSGEVTAVEWASKKEISLSNIRMQICQSLAFTVKWFIDHGLEHTLLITGGDALQALMHQLGVDALLPICEVSPGVVLSAFTYGKKQHYIMSKSGGFGQEDLLVDIAAALTKKFPTKLQNSSS